LPADSFKAKLSTQLKTGLETPNLPKVSPKFIGKYKQIEYGGDMI